MQFGLLLLFFLHYILHKDDECMFFSIVPQCDHTYSDLLASRTSRSIQFYIFRKLYIIIVHGAYYYEYIITFWWLSSFWNPPPLHLDISCISICRTGCPLKCACAILIWQIIMYDFTLAIDHLNTTTTKIWFNCINTMYHVVWVCPNKSWKSLYMY